jgi:gluconolactonase
VLTWDIGANGELNSRGVLYHADGHGWDGLAVDGAGNVCASNLQHSGITIISPEGVPLQEVTVPEYDPYVTNICFGGPDGRTAFITSSGRGKLYATEWAYPGLRLNFAC